MQPASPLYSNSHVTFDDTVLQSSLTDRKTNLRSFIYSHSLTNSTNLVKIGLVDFEIIGLTKIVEINKQIHQKQKQNIILPSAAASPQQPGRLNNVVVDQRQLYGLNRYFRLQCHTWLCPG